MPSKTRRAIKDLSIVDIQSKIDFPCRKTRSSCRTTKKVVDEDAEKVQPIKTRKRSTKLSKIF